VALTDRPQKVGPPDGSNGQRPLSPAPRPYNWRATVGLIVGIVVVAGAMGVFMRVIPTPFTQPAPTSAPSVRPTAQPAAAPIAPTTAPVAAPTPAATDFVRNQPATVAPAAQPTAPAGAPATVGLVIGPLTAPTAQPTDSEQSQPATVAPATQPTPASTTVPQPTPVPTAVPATEPTAAPTLIDQPATAAAVDPALQAAILDAYDRYWQVRDDALATLDGSHLDEVMSGEELVAAETYLDQLRSQGRAGRPNVEHSITLVSATSDAAEIQDRIIDRGFFVDATTQEPLPPDQQAAQPETEIVGTYLLRNIDGVWKVTAEE